MLGEWKDCLAPGCRDWGIAGEEEPRCGVRGHQRGLSSRCFSWPETFTENLLGANSVLGFKINGYALA